MAQRTSTEDGRTILTDSGISMENFGSVISLYIVFFVRGVDNYDNMDDAYTANIGLYCFQGILM